MKARQYYLERTRDLGWTRSVLEVQIKSGTYERDVIDHKQHNFKEVLPQALAEQADKTMKSTYMLDMLGKPSQS